MTNATSLLIPDTSAKEDALLAEIDNIFEALLEFKNISDQQPALHALTALFAQAASADNQPATQAQMEDAYNQLSLTAMSRGLKAAVELHHGLLVKQAFINENLHMHQPPRDYRDGLAQTIKQVRNVSGYFYANASGALDACAEDFSPQFHAQVHNHVENLWQIFHQQLKNRGLPAPEITETTLEYGLERGKQGLALSTAFRNVIVSGLAVMRQELGFYGYAYGKADYPQLRLQDTRVEERQRFCDLMTDMKGLMQWLSTCKGYADREVSQAKTAQSKASDKQTPPALH